MAITPVTWTPFASEEERLEYLKDHKLTPKTYKEPKPLFYSGLDAEGSELCTAEGVADSCTLVIRVGEEYHCIHPDYLLEMQSRKGSAPAAKRSAPRRVDAPEKAAKSNKIDFVAIDFETATSAPNSACSLGIAVVRNLEISETWYHLIQPPRNYYEEGNVYVHGITPAQTADQPTLDQLWPEIRQFFDGTLVLAHNARFDTGVLRSSLSDPSQVPDFKYADTLHMVRDVVPGRHGLDACCDYFGIELTNHHNGLADAIACAEIAIRCAKEAGCTDFAAYVKQEKLPRTDFHRKRGFNAYAAKAVKMSELSATVDQFDMTHTLYQKTLVFTGDLSIDRAEAMQMALNKGAVVKSGVSGKTNILVIGRKGEAPGAPMNSKERKARELTESGKADIRLMEEEEFLSLVK